MQEIIEAWLVKKMTEIDQKIANLAQRYGTASPDEIETLIRNGTIPGHPAWEDVIRLEGLEEYRQKLRQQIAGMKKSANGD